MVPVFVNQHVRCPSLSAKDDEDVENHIFSSYDWMNSQGIAEHAKYGRFCLTLGGKTHFWYESVSPMGNE